MADLKSQLSLLPTDVVCGVLAGEAEGGCESDMESEPAPATAAVTGEDAGAVAEEQEGEEETKEAAVDGSVEEQGEEVLAAKEPSTQSQADLSQHSQQQQPALPKAEEPKPQLADTEKETVPAILPAAELDPPKEVASPPQTTFAPFEGAVCAKDSGETVSESCADVVQVPEPLVASVVEENKEESKTEESAPELTQMKEDPVPVKEETKPEEQVQPSPPLPPVVSKVDAEKPAPLHDPTIPQLKKIDLDLPPAEEKKEGKEKEKLKSGKKVSRESKKSRQNEMRSSLSEIPTLEPMTTPSPVKVAPVDVAPSPYDFNDTEPEPVWQPEITKKWEPSIKPLAAFRDVKMELKKSLETEKKKVKKKTKKATEETIADGDKPPLAESPAKSPDKKGKEASPVKKGRKKKAGDGEVKVDTSSYEETVNSVVESCKMDDDYVRIPLPPLPVPKEEKPVKKRKSKVMDSTAEKSDEGSEGGKKEPVKPVKALKGKIPRKKKEAKTSDSAVEQTAVPVPVPLPVVDAQIPLTTITPQEHVPSSQSQDPVPIKKPRLEAEIPTSSSSSSSSSSSVSVCAASWSVPAPKPGPSGMQLLSMASIRPVASTSAANAGGAPCDRLAPLAENSHSDLVLPPPVAQPRYDCAGDVAKPPCSVGNTVLDNTPPTTPENDLDEANSASSSEGHDNLKEDLDSLDSGERTCKRGSESPPGCDFSLSSTSSENLPSSSSGAQSSGQPSKSAETVTSKRKKKEEVSVPVKKKKRLVSRSTRGDRNKKSPKCKYTTY